MAPAGDGQQTVSAEERVLAARASLRRDTAAEVEKGPIGKCRSGRFDLLVRQCDPPGSMRDSRHQAFSRPSGSVRQSQPPAVRPVGA
jgi:hypothetical protein